MSGKICPSATMEKIEYRKQVATKILELFEKEKMDISDCEMTLFTAKEMLKSCYIQLRKPVTAEPLQANK